MRSRKEGAHCPRREIQCSDHETYTHWPRNKECAGRNHWDNYKTSLCGKGLDSNPGMRVRKDAYHQGLGGDDALQCYGRAERMINKKGKELDDRVISCGAPELI